MGIKMPPKNKQQVNEQLDTFVLAFMGEFVSVITDIMIVDYAQNDVQTIEQNSPMIARGFLLDSDNNYLYLGDNPLEVTQAVARNRITMVQIERKKTKYEEILDELGDPGKKEDIN
jgi:hypothetical protein